MSSGQSIAHYRIAPKVGEGGMGEVYRATDTKLNRDIAIKVLPDAFAQDPNRMARFASRSPGVGVAQSSEYRGNLRRGRSRHRNGVGLGTHSGGSHCRRADSLRSGDRHRAADG
jgi:serine/threonine protein kinase